MIYRHLTVDKTYFSHMIVKWCRSANRVGPPGGTIRLRTHCGNRFLAAISRMFPSLNR